MEDDQERERFAMEKDYEGGREIGVGFYYGKCKEKRHQTKDDCEGGSGMKKRSQESDQNSKEEYEKDDGGRPGLGLGASGSAIAGIGIGFNPRNANWGKEENANDGGALGSGMKKRSQESDQNSKEEYEKDDGGRPGLGVGASGSAIAGIGIGFNPRNANRGKEENANDGGGLGSGMKKRSQESDQNSKEEYEKDDGGRPGLGLGKAIAGIGIGFNPRKANWGKEENANDGGGLGKNIGMGFSEYEEAANAAGLLEEEKKALPQPTGIQLKRKVWTKQGKLKKLKAECGEEFLVKNQQQGIHLVHNVLDMRGPKLRVLTKLDNLNAEENDSPMPEIQHNLRVLVEMAEFDMHKIDDELTKEKKNVVSLQQDLDKLKGDAALQEKHLHSMEKIVCVMDRLEEQSQLGILTLESLAKSVMELQQDFPEEYKLNCLSKIACSLAMPLLDRLLQGWDPLIKPTEHLEAVSAWKGILQEDEICYSLYTQFFMEVVFPHVRRAITNTWQAIEAEPLLQFLESWQDVLPRSAQENILDHVVMPKLTAAVNSWDPRRDTIPIHLWLHPWVSLLGQKLEPLYLTIRSQLTSFLGAWHPSDVSAYTILSPWKPVFDRASWEQMMVLCIVPKLLEVMHELQLNPADKNFDKFFWVTTWATVIPIHHMLNILDVFFNKWQQFLFQWLYTKPNFQEVKNWFMGWRDLIPAELLSNKHVELRLNETVELMNQAAQGLELVLPAVRENISYLKAPEMIKLEKAKAAAQFAKFQTNGMCSKSFKEVIELQAERHNLLFKPKPGRMQDGHQVYGFGNISIIIDSLNQKVFAQAEDKWSLVTLDQLVKSHGMTRPRVLKI